MESLRCPSLVTAVSGCAVEPFIIPGAKCLPLAHGWSVLSYPAASFCLSVKTCLSFRAQLQSFFLLDAFPSLSSRKGVPFYTLGSVYTLLPFSSITVISWNARAPLHLLFPRSLKKLKCGEGREG